MEVIPLIDVSNDLDAANTDILFPTEQQGLNDNVLQDGVESNRVLTKMKHNSLSSVTFSLAPIAHLSQ